MLHLLITSYLHPASRWFCQVRIGSAPWKKLLYERSRTGDKFCQHVGCNITGKDLGVSSLYSLTCLFLAWSSFWEVGKHFHEEIQYWHVVSAWLTCHHFGKIFFRVYGACSANYFLTNIFTHTKLHQHVCLILINSLANILVQFVAVYKLVDTRFYPWFLVSFPNHWFLI